ncbi:exodeoxyribonuclease-like [Amphiura filiformis]|uniref:exodeoxyribonuclease-like n=1 Tax=Amphiura filiformis TaxID=82378 RepID=UPI003B21091F
MPPKRKTEDADTEPAAEGETPAKKAATEGNGSAEAEETPSLECDKKAENGESWNFKAVAWNTGGFKSWLKKGGMNYVKEEQPDILFLQEVKIVEKDVTAEGKPDGYHVYWNPAISKKGYSGTALYSKIEPIDVKYGMGIEKHDQEGRLITAEYEKFYFIGCYVPNSGRKLVRLDYRQEWDKDFLEYIKGLKDKKPIIYAGDLNVAHLEIDLKNPKNNKNKTPGFCDVERDALTNLLNEGFVDSFRHLYPDKELFYSFWTYMMNCRAKNVGWRLDYFVLSKSMVPQLCESTMRHHVMGSDHCPIVLFMAM